MTAAKNQPVYREGVIHWNGDEFVPWYDDAVLELYARTSPPPPQPAAGEVPRPMPGGFYFGGLAAGAYFLATLVDLAGGEEDRCRHLRTGGRDGRDRGCLESARQVGS